MKKVIISALIGLGIFGTGYAQGGKDGADKTLRGSGRVNPSTLAMEFDLPLGSYPGRGINVPVSLSYSSKLWRMKNVGSTEGSRMTGGCRSLNEATYSENSASGWTTSLATPYIEYVGMDNLFSPEGFPLNTGLECVNAPPEPSNQAAYVRRLTIHLPSGETHELRADEAPLTYDRGAYPCPPPNGVTYCEPNHPQNTHVWNQTYYAVDGSNIKYVEDSTTVPATYRLLMPDGSYYDFEGNRSNVYGATARKGIKFADRNGNYTSFNASTGAWTDTLGKVIPAPIGPTAPASPTATGSPQVYQMPGMTGVYKFHWKHLKGSSPEESGLTVFNQDLKYAGNAISQITWGSWNWRPAGTFLFGSEPTTAYVLSGQNLFNPVVLTEIELPTGQKYKFSYNIHGLIEHITFPTGGSEKFVHSVVAPLTQSFESNVSDQTNFGVTNRKVYETAGQGTPYEWSYSTTHVAPSGYVVSVTSPDQTRSERFLHQGNQPCPGCDLGTFGYDNGLAGMPYEELSFDSGSPRKLVSRKLTHWQKKSFPGSGVATSDWHPRVEFEKTIAYDPSGNGDAVSATTTYEYEGNLSLRETPVLVKKTTQYAYEAVEGGGSLLDPPCMPEEEPCNPPPNPTPIPTATPPSTSPPVKIIETNYLINDPDYAAVKSYYTAQNMVGLPTLMSVKNSLGIVVTQNKMKYDESGYSPSVGRSNVTSTQVWDSTKGDVTDANAYVTTRAKFDDYGNQIEATDANGQTTFTEYSPIYNHAYPTKITSSIPDPSGQNGSSSAFITSTSYHLITGLPLSTTDANGQISTTEYNDLLLRPTKAIASNGRQTITEYDNQQSRWVKVRTQIDDMRWSEATAYADGLGRAIKTDLVDSNGNVFTETEYDNMSRVVRATNRYRQGEQKLWNKTEYDDSGRIKESFASAPEGQTGLSLGTIQYSISLSNSVGTVVTRTDAAGKKTRSITNELEQVIRVDEATGNNELGGISSPNQATFYTYNTLGKLIKVQQGNQNRHFLHDSMGRLLRFRQPEQEINLALNTTDNPENNNWGTGFTFDDNGNILTSTDSKNVTVTNIYDNLNRIKARSYSDSTPAVNYFYDDSNVLFSKGKLTRVSSSVSISQTTSFDNLGRALNYQQTTDGKTYTSQYQYNLSGGLVQETYPSGRIVKYETNAEGNLSRVWGQINGQAKTYANSFSYTAAGAIESLKLGNGRWEAALFNNRNQVVQLGLGNSSTDSNQWKVNYDYGELNADNTTVNSAKNNGNIARQVISYSGVIQPFIQTYKFDAVNRLTEARETNIGTQTWQQTFGYDQYGNRTSRSQNIGATQLVINNLTLPSIDSYTNRFQSGQGYSYDKNGNLTTDAQNRTFIFNGDNKQTQVKDDADNVVGTYYYDGNGKRIKKITTSETTIFVYSGEKLIAEYSTAISPTPQTSYLTADILGSPRVITDQLGNVTSRRDFMPFGEELGPDGTYRKTSDKYNLTVDSVRQKFTTYHRDNETNLDFAEARFYNSDHGRFTAVDPLLASGKSADPQTFNRYIYVMNNPLIATDPSGMLPVYYRVLPNGQVEFSEDPVKDGKGKWKRYRGGEQIHDATNGNRYRLTSDGITNLGRIPKPPPVRAPSDMHQLIAGSEKVLWWGRPFVYFLTLPVAIAAVPVTAPALTTLALTEATTGAATTVLPIMAANPDKVARVVNGIGTSGGQLSDGAQKITGWLGPNWTKVTNTGSDLMLRSADGARSIRFDLINSHGDKPHINIQTWERLIRGWVETTPNAHIYPK